MASFTKLVLSLALPMVASGASGAPLADKTCKLPEVANMRYQAHNYKSIFQSDRNAGVEKINREISQRAKKGMGKTVLQPDFSLPASDQYEYIDGPDGSVYFCTSEFETVDIVISEYFTKKDIRAYKFTIYDDKFNVVGDISGKIALDSITDPSNPENGVASVGITPLITKKFFNSDEKMEVLVYLNMNTDNYTVNSRSVAYQIGGNKDDEGYDVPLCTIHGNLCDVLEAPSSKWSEDFYLSFASDYIFPSDPEDDSFGAYVNSMGLLIETYKKAGYSGKEPEKFFEYKMRLNDYPGDQESATPFISLNIDGKPYFVINGYTDGLWLFEGEDEYGFPDQIWNENTDFFVEVYQPRSLDDPNLLQRTVIDMQKSEGSDIFATFYYLGDLSYRNDINFDYCDEPGKANFVITKRDWVGAEMGTTASYYLYAPDGSLKATIGENIDGVLAMSDVAGQEPEFMFITYNGDEYLFSFLCPYNGNIHHSFSQVLTWDGRPEGLYVNADRVAAGDSYKYCFELYALGMDDDGNDLMRIGWVNTDGEIMEVEEVNMGKNVTMATVYLDSRMLNPYIFDATPQREYMIILKRGDAYSSAIQEELIVASASSNGNHDYDPLLHLVPDDRLGNLMQVSPLESDGIPMLRIVYYNYETAKYSQEFYSLPFTKFAGGDGSVDNPFRIASIGDFQCIRDNMSAHYEIVNDLDAEGYNFRTMGSATAPFTGTIKGNGHVIRNLTIGNNENNNAIFSYTDNAEITGITFLNPTLNITGSLYYALVAAQAQRSTFSDIHVYGLNVDSQSEGEFGVIANKASLNTIITGCSVANASVNLPNFTIVGGIAADTRTGSSINASSFSGSINANSVVGGILGTTGPNSGGVSDCHVDADIAAAHIVGGIVGEIDQRALITRCYVEGSISASEVFGTSIVNKGYAAGGIAGAVSTIGHNYGSEGEESSENDNIVISNCFVNLESINTPALPDGHQSSVHRIAGFTSINDIQPDWENITDYTNIDKFLPTEAEAGFVNNYAAATLAKGDSGIASETTTTEGKDVEDSALNSDFFTSLGFCFGATATQPWKEIPENDPMLYHEAAAKFVVDEITVVENTSFYAELVIVSRQPITADEFIDGFACEIADEEVVAMTGEFSLNKNVASIGLSALKEGQTEFTANVNGNLATVRIKVIDAISAGIDDVVSEDGYLTISFDGTKISAPDSYIEVYAVNGTRVASGNNVISLESLSDGFYVVIAVDNEGHKASRKFLLR